MPAFRQRMPMSFAVATLVTAMAGCGDPVGVRVCTAEARPSIEVFVRDAVSNAPIASGTTLVLRDGAYADSLTSPFAQPSNNEAPLSPITSYERAGTYSLTVRRPNYASWDTTGVRVTRGPCHVNTVTLTARLAPLE